MIGALQTTGLRPVVLPHQVHTGGQRAKIVADTALMTTQMSPDYSFRVALPEDTSVFHNIAPQIAARITGQIKKTVKHETFESHIRQVKHYIRHRHLRATTDAAALRRYLRRLARGNSAYELALLEGIVILAKQDDLFQGLGYDDDAIKNFVLDNEQPLRAYLNIAAVLEQYVHIDTPNELMGTYQDIMITSTSTLSALAATIRKLGIGALPTWLPFLMKAAVSDLCSPQVGADKVHLLFVLSELKSFRILNTLVAFLKKLQSDRLHNKPLDDLLLTSLDFASQPVATMPTVEKWIALATHPEQILFLQDYRNFFARVSLDAYKNEQEQQNAKAVLQKRIDHLVYTEED